MVLKASERRRQLWSGRFAADSPPEGAGFELVVPFSVKRKREGWRNDKRRPQDGEYRKRDRGFESGSLQRGVSSEPNRATGPDSIV